MRRPDGLAALDRAAEHIEAALSRLTPDPFDPDSAAAARRAATLHHHAMEEWRRATVQRPVSFRTFAVTFGGESPLLGMMAQLDLAQLCARRLWNRGYEPGKIARMVSAMPPRLILAVRRLAAATQRAAQAAAQRRALAAAATGARPGSCSDSWQLGGEEAAWEQETELGLVRIDACARCRCCRTFGSSSAVDECKA